MLKRHHRIAAAAGALLGALALTRGAAADELYRWWDAQGRMHYGEAPPGDAVRIERVGAQKNSGTSSVTITGAQGPSSSNPRSHGEPASSGPQRRGPVQVRPSGDPTSMEGDPPPDAEPQLPEAADSSESIGGMTESQWRAQARSYRASIAAAEKNLEAVEENERNRFALSGGSTRYDRIDSAKDRLQQAKDALSSLEDRARQNEVPPGWLD